jgi:hypothetical protein
MCGKTVQIFVQTKLHTCKIQFTYTSSIQTDILDIEPASGIIPAPLLSSRASVLISQHLRPLVHQPGQSLRPRDH